MAGRKNTETRSRETVAGRYRDDESERGGGDGKAKALSGRADDNGRGTADSSADELGRRAWEATYKNRRKSRGD
jgi:hypothetical protein